VSSQSNYAWIRLDVALAIHEAVIAEHGGSLGSRDAGLLESALARPQQAWSYADPQPSAAELAAIYAVAISRNHPFVDGNKRVAFAVLETFLDLNGFRLAATDSECISTMWALAGGSLSDDDFTAWVTEHAQPRK
jgi:death-on-curing protein